MKIGITGASGRMGKTVIKAVIENELTDIAAAFDKKESDVIGKDIGIIAGLDKLDINVCDNLEKIFDESEAVIDFSSPKLTLECASLAAKHNKILVSGTTGFTGKEKEQLINYGNDAVIIWSSNMSIGVNLLIKLSEKVAKILHDDYDAEIFEMHHRNKVDAPSGTALCLGEAVAKGRGLDFGEVSRKTRDGIIGKRSKKEIGFSSLRGGDVIGDHSVIFAGIGERVELSHKASNREIYARGAIRAAIWGSAKENGFYSMRDVLSDID